MHREPSGRQHTTTMTGKTPDLSLTGVSGKREGLLPPHRVSAIYEETTQATKSPTTTIRLLACASGVGLITSAIMTAVHSIINSQITVVDIILIIISAWVGIFALFLESNLPYIIQSVRSTITHNIPICGLVTWRGGIYTIAGLLNFAILDPLHIAVALFSTGVGIHMIKVGKAAGEHLVKLRASITDEKTLLKAFMRHDENGDGYLQQEEFESLMLSLGMELDRDELDATFFQIDVDNDKNIVYDEFRSWWKQTTSDARVMLL
jgi:hypothetical protein